MKPYGKPYLPLIVQLCNPCANKADTGRFAETQIDIIE